MIRLLQFWILKITNVSSNQHFFEYLLAYFNNGWYLSLMIAYCRLVSAYQDKVVDVSDTSYTMVRYNLQRRYGKVSFYNFARQILHHSRHNCRYHHIFTTDCRVQSRLVSLRVCAVFFLMSICICCVPGWGIFVFSVLILGVSWFVVFLNLGLYDVFWELSIYAVLLGVSGSAIFSWVYILLHS